MASNSEETEDFMDNPLITWLKCCLGDPDMVIDYNDLVDGGLLYQVLLQIDPEPTYSGVTPTLGNPLQRIRNLEIILKNLQNLYREELNQIIIAVPNVARLGTEPHTPRARDDLKLLMLLLLACAVQCPNKEVFIERIKLLPLDAQHSIVDDIKQFTDTPLKVLSADHESQLTLELLLSHVRRLVSERDELLASWVSAHAGDADKQHVTSTLSNSSSSESHHLAVELADWKSKLRKQRQELEEKTEALNECRDELEVERSVVSRLRQELADVVQDARSAKAYRDELDVMREKAERADKLESELERLKTKLRDVDFFKTRVEELRDDNRVLMETREMLEGQLERAKRRADRVMDLEAEILKLKQLNNELSLERDAKDRKLEELYAEHAELQLLARCTQPVDTPADTTSPTHSGDSILGTQLSNNATARALRLELENHRLRSTIDNLKESTLHESNAKLLECQHQNKQMSINMEQLEEQCKRLAAENKELETLAKDALHESRKLEESRESLRKAIDSQQTELQNSREQLETLQRRLNETLQERASEVAKLSELEIGRELAAVVPDLEEKLACARRQLEASEAHVVTLQKEITRLRQVVEASDAKHDEILNEVEQAKKDKEELRAELQTTRCIVVRLHEVEKERDEVQSRAQVSDQALQALQSELIELKVDSQNLRSGLTRLGINPEMLKDPGVTIASLKDQLPAELREECQQCAELAALREELARQQVQASTLLSQINSLSSQHTALQLANTQLAAEKEQLEEERKAERGAHEQLLKDQTSLQRLHEQLTSENEVLVKKQETLRQQVRSQQREIQTLRETITRLETAQDRVKAEREELIEKRISLKNLRDEHSKLKGDFQNLFQSNTKLKEEYGRMKTLYQALLTQQRNWETLNGQLKDELLALSDSERNLMSQLHKLTQANSMLEEDRRSVMEHASILLHQYQELLTHSLEDNQHYHAEEKQFADKVNQLMRQKEKLEEKIMDQYRQLGTPASKKKGFGRSMVQKLYKAGSEIINRSRRGIHEESRGSINIQGEESGENESDASLDEVRQDEDSGPLPRILKQQSAGTRQTVYEAEPGVDPGPGGLYVINKVNATTVINSPTPPSPTHSAHNANENRRKTRKDDVYFDYGCV